MWREVGRGRSWRKNEKNKDLQCSLLQIIQNVKKINFLYVYIYICIYLYELVTVFKKKEDDGYEYDTVIFSRSRVYIEIFMQTNKVT